MDKEISTNNKIDLEFGDNTSLDVNEKIFLIIYH